jgi:hypothetical protein
MLEYEVVIQDDKFFTGRFDADVLETTLNGYAAHGWRLVESVVAFNVWKSLKAELVLILERPQGASG